MTDQLNSNIPSCFETYADKYLELGELKNFHVFRFFMVHLAAIISAIIVGYQRGTKHIHTIIKPECFLNLSVTKYVCTDTVSRSTEEN